MAQAISRFIGWLTPEREVVDAIGIRTMRITLILLVIFGLYVLAVGIFHPIMDHYYFRQTQTALTAYWLTQGGPWLAYETPVLGAPWAIPFEFPVFQLIAAAVATTGVPLDAAGRLVNFGFFVATLWPLAILFRALRLSQASYLATAILFVASPLYLYWSRTFLIETCALFFAVLWLALLARYLVDGHRISAGGAIVAGCLGILAKSTTFPAFALLGGLGAALFLLREWRAGRALPQLAAKAAVIAVVFVLPFAVGLAWVRYSDQVKMANEFGQMLTSSGLVLWNFGTLEMRMGKELWDYTVYRRLIPDTLGTLYYFGFLAVVAALVSRRHVLTTIAAIIGFVTPMLLFTNLHMVHNYYHLAGGIFVAIAAGLGVGHIFDKGFARVAVGLLAIVVAGQIYYFWELYMPAIKNDLRDDRLMRIGFIAKANTSPGQSLIVIGDDWSSAIPYYSQRKSLTLAGWFPSPITERVLADPQAFLGDQPFGGVVYCADKLAEYGPKASLIEAFIAGRSQLGKYAGCQMLSATR